MNKSGRLIIMLGVCICAGMLFSISPFADGEQKAENGYLIFKVEPKDAKAVVLQGGKEIGSFEGGADRYALPPGKYTLRLEAKDRKKLELPFEIKAQKDTDLQTLKLPFPNGTICWTFESQEGLSIPIIVGEKFFFLDHLGTIFCLDHYSGTVLWKKKLFDRYAYLSSDGKNIFAVSYKGNLLCLDPEKGKTVWEYKISKRSGILGLYMSTTPSADAVYLHVNGELLCIDSATGKQKWRKTDAECFSVYSDGYIYVGNQTMLQVGENVAFREIRQLDVRTGLQKKIFRIPKIEKKGNAVIPFWGNRYEYCKPRPLVFGKQLYIVHLDDSKNLYCFDTETGKLKWTYSPQENISPDISISEDGKLYLLAIDLVGFDKFISLHCLDAESGKRQWRIEVKPDRKPLSNPIVADENVYFVAGQQLFCIDAKTGEQKWAKLFHDKNRTQDLDLLALSRDRLFIVTSINNKFPAVLCIQIDDTGSGDWVTLNGNPANTNTKVPPGGLAPVKKKK